MSCLHLEYPRNSTEGFLTLLLSFKPLLYFQNFEFDRLNTALLRSAVFFRNEIINGSRLFFCRHEDTGLRPFTQVYREQNVLGTKIT